ncbi:hypothetical protein FSP39_003237 [Pinctada imbricata]|uniref:Cytochrome-b5 reductase n=1 Tax=Pinctada imbricata TaxID=66713 RepID=A0AA88XYE6_PINIB|nr:hypothetical protein FSP39_003237 [Pinctada imbricata]
MSQNFLSPIFPAPNSQQRISQSNERKKVALRPGRSLMDWIRLGRSGKDLTGVGGKVFDVSMDELSKHNKKDDAWMAIRGKVYNVTPYLEYHPGGEDELMRGAGLDGTQLFDEIHKWVNYESMLEKCYIGKLKAATPVKKRGASTTILKPPSGPIPPKFDWYQSSSSVTLVVYTKWTHMSHEFVIIDKSERNFISTLYIEDYIYNIHIVQVHKDSGKTEICLSKLRKDLQWKSVGKHLDQHNSFVRAKDKDFVYRQCTVDSVSQVTHDTKLLCISLPHQCRMCVPIGYHVYLRHKISDMDIVRSYTVVLPSLLPDQQDSRVTEGRVFYLMIKIYKDGVFTPWIDGLKQGDVIEVSSFDGNFSRQQLSQCSDLVLYAAGTGFTPMVSLIYNSLHTDPQCNRKVKLVFFNKTQEDILWRDQLDKLSQEFDRLSIEYVLSNADDSWTGRRGRIQGDLVRELTPKPDLNDKLLICACGPTPFTNSALQ